MADILHVPPLAILAGAAVYFLAACVWDGGVHSTTVGTVILGGVTIFAARCILRGA